MKISIIVPMYNSKLYINKLIDSVLNQTYDNYEVILVDDGSQDNINKYLKDKYSDSRIKYYWKENSGPGFSRKFGYEKCNGDLIFFVDSDDWISSSDSLEIINTIFENNEIDVLFFDREDIIENKKNIIKGFYKINPGIHYLNEIKELIRPGLGSKIFKKDFLDSNMFINTLAYEDLYTTYLYLEKCKNFYYIDKSFYTIYHSKNGVTLSSVINKENFGSKLRIIYELYKRYENSSLKYSIELRMVYLIMAYSKMSKKDINNELESIIQQFVIILKKDNVKYVKEYSDVKFYMLKKVYFKLILNYYFIKMKL